MTEGRAGAAPAAALLTDSPAGRPDPVPGGQGAIGAHRLLGDGRSAALLRPDGCVDWWCAPDLDSPPVLWSLLDPDGPSARWCDVGPDRDPGGRSDADTRSGSGPGSGSGSTAVPAGPVLTSRLRTTAGARLESRDGLLSAGDGSDAVVLVRLVRALDGDLDVAHQVLLRPGDAWAPGAPPRRVELRADAAAVEEPGGESLRHRLRAERGVWTGLTLTVGGPPPPSDDHDDHDDHDDPSDHGDHGDPADHDDPAGPVDVAALGRALDDAQRRAEQRAHDVLAPAEHPGRGRDALRVLAACTYGPTGAVVASPTTSLPEVVGGERQWDYRYSWLRDSSLAVSVASLLGQGDQAVAFLRFVRGVLAALPGGDPMTAPPVVTVRGEPVPDERTVEGVPGFGGSRPVRVGNGAAGQVQHDSLGLLIEATSVHLQTGGVLEDETWQMVRRIADGITAVVLSDAIEPSSGIWELREPALLVGEDIGRWVALDRALWIARGWRPTARRKLWRQARAVVARRVLGALTPDGGLPQSYGEDPPRSDAVSLLLAAFGLMDREDPRTRRLVDTTLADLAAGDPDRGLLYRYPPDGRDGLAGREGAFLPVSFWAVAALAAVGEVEAARARLDALCAGLPGLLAEMAGPDTGAMLGNTPLLWTHMELARALYVVEAAERRQRSGAVGLTAWRLARYLRLCRRARARRARAGAAPG